MRVRPRAAAIVQVSREMGRRRAGRGAYTLLEAAVAVGVVALLAACLAPAIHSAREAATALRCRARLRDLGIAIQAHESAHLAYPPAADPQPSFLARLLPYLDSAQTYDRCNFEDRDGQANFTVGKAVVAAFLCPSFPLERDPLGDGLSCYAGNRGVDPGRRGGWGDGFLGRPLRPRDFADGLSRTAMVAEWLPEPRDGGGAPIYVRSVRGWSDDLTADSDCRGGVAADFLHDSGPSTWLNIEPHYDHTLPPGRPACELTDPRGEVGFWTTVPANGLHAFVNVLMGDGSVCAVSPAVDSATWRAAGTRTSGEVADRL